VLHKVLAGRMLKSAEAGILEGRKLALEVRMGLIQQRVERHPEERKHLQHRWELVLT
jgi:hypothetical protein